MMTLMFALALSGATADAATAQADATTETAAKPEKAKPKLICRRIADTGSRLPERECKTQADWDRQADTTNRKLGGSKD